MKHVNWAVVGVGLGLALLAPAFVGAQFEGPGRNAPSCMITCPANITRSSDTNQCGAVVNYPPPTTSGLNCGTVACSPASGSFYPVGTTTTTCTTTAGPTCSFTVTVVDAQPPDITCPANVNLMVPGGTTVNFPSPLIADNCPSPGGVCVPASGSFFPLGTTTDTCTATDAGGNTATCSFKVTLGTAYYTVPSCRVLDTRNPDGPYGGPALMAGADRTFTIGGQCGVPATAKAVSVNLAVTQPTATGNLRLYPAGTPLPVVTSINYVTGQTRTNNAIVVLNAQAAMAVHCAQASGTVHFILDVNGYIE